MTRRVGYFQCVGGVSGDMILGALVECGVSIVSMRRVVDALNLDGVAIDARRDHRHGAQGTLVTVHVEGGYQHTIADFIAMVNRSGLPERVVEDSRAILIALARAEEAVHGTPGDETALHELGSADTVVDVVCAVAGLSELGVQGVFSSPIPTGSGVVDTGHGLTPVPAPATMALLTAKRAPTAPPVEGAEAAGEMVTPTGAAILTELAEFRQPRMTIDSAGFGMGSRDPEEYPNVLGLWVGEESSAPERLVLLETNVDDDTPEVLSHAIERLLALGARDAWLTPARMKKGRAGWVLSALVEAHLERSAVELILRETSTLGVRVTGVSRHEAGREQVMVETEFGHLPVKVKRVAGEVVGASPEYESARRVALEKAVPLRTVMEAARRAAVDTE